MKHWPSLHWTSISAGSAELLPSSAIVGWVGQSHCGYCITHTASASANALLTSALTPQAAWLPQQSI